MVGGEDFLSRRSRAKEDKEFPDEVPKPYTLNPKP